MSPFENRVTIRHGCGISFPSPFFAKGVDVLHRKKPNSFVGTSMGNYSNQSSMGTDAVFGSKTT
jgi:hypothetical protein